MALTFGFYNSIGHDRKYDAIQFGSIFDGIIKDGVYRSYKQAMIVKESSQDNQVIIQPGRAWFDHTWSYNDNDFAVTLDGPESYLDRIDAVVLDINSNSNYRKNSYMVIKGTPAGSSPPKPSLVREAGHNQYPLCYVYRHGGSTGHIYQSDIENTVGTSECPFVIGVIQGITVDELLLQWSGEFERYMQTQETSFNNWRSNQEIDFNNWRNIQEQSFFAWMEHEKDSWYANIDHNTIAWDNWFSHIQYQLDGDVAGHLQNEIDWIRKFSSIYIVDKTLYVPMSAASVVGTKLIFATDH